MYKKSSAKSEGPILKIVVVVVIALLVGGSSPWWWTKLFHHKPVPVPSPLEHSPDILRTQPPNVASDNSTVITSTAQTMKERCRAEDFNSVYDLAMALLKDDQNNGHGLYFSGEVCRVKAKQDPSNRERMREHFLRYLTVESALPLSERDGNAADCYRRPKGYCAARTAWINHLMAIDYYRQGQDATDKENKIKCFQRALEFVKKDLQFGGFDQNIPSTVLKSRVQEELQGLGGL